MLRKDLREAVDRDNTLYLQVSHFTYRELTGYLHLLHRFNIITFCSRNRKSSRVQFEIQPAAARRPKIPKTGVATTTDRLGRAVAAVVVASTMCLRSFEVTPPFIAT